MTFVVSASAAINLKLPALMCRLAGLKSTGSDYFFRSGLDGSTQYMTSIYQAIFWPFDPRHWPVAFYVVITLLVGVCLQCIFRQQRSYFLKQAGFLLIPYATIAILLPQLTSIHPYFTDLLLVIPAIFLLFFWSLQREFWQKMTGATYVLWIIVAGLVLMTNLLTIAQNLRH